MSALHFYLGGERSFSETPETPRRPLGAISGDVPSSGRKDSWSQAFDAAPQGTTDELLAYEEIQYHHLHEDENAKHATALRHYPTYALAGGQSQPRRLLPGVA